MLEVTVENERVESYIPNNVKLYRHKPYFEIVEIKLGLNVGLMLFAVF